jgi:hypothetical protein
VECLAQEVQGQYIRLVIHMYELTIPSAHALQHLNPGQQQQIFQQQQALACKYFFAAIMELKGLLSLPNSE